jgi:hypothetical protein
MRGGGWREPMSPQWLCLCCFALSRVLYVRDGSRRFVEMWAGATLRIWFLEDVACASSLLRSCMCCP